MIKKMSYIIIFICLFSYATNATAQIKGGVSKVNITNTEPEIIVNDSLYVKALILDDSEKKVVIITVDVVALEEIGYMPDDYLEKVRSLLYERFNIHPKNVIINASHGHGIPSSDVFEKTISAVEGALKDLQVVQVGISRGMEERISINRRLKLLNGKQRDIRHAYSLPPDDNIMDVGVIDPEIGIMVLRTMDDKPLAVLYNFAAHPIQGVPSKGNRGNTAGFPGYASDLIEKVFGGETTAFFIQGAAGDINPVLYKNVATPRNAETLGIMLGSSILKQINQAQYKEVENLEIHNEVIELPLADLTEAIDSLELRKADLVNSLNGTSLNIKTFMYLYIKYHLNKEYPSYYAHQYLHEEKMDKEHFLLLDEENRNLITTYLNNIKTMEEITVVKTNLALLKKHQESYEKSESKFLNAEVNVVKIGEFVLVTFPGELSVEIGLNIKEMSPYDFTYISAYTNGYIYYAPTDDQLKNNRGGAQEDSESVLGVGWQKKFEEQVYEILRQI